jgi:iron complex outermembrane receptor protein
VNGALYHNDYEDLQVSEYTPPIVGSAGGNVAINANARYQGGELEIQAVPIERLTLTASAGVVDRFYKTYPRNLAAGAALTPGCKAIAGTTIAQDCAAIASFTHNPKTSSDFSAYYVLPAADYGEWSFFVAYSRKGRVDYSAFDLPPASPNHAVIAGKAYGLLIARIALSHIPMAGGHVRGQIAIYGDNLTDQDYVLQGTELATYAGIAWAPGRTIGIEGKVEF